MNTVEHAELGITDPSEAAKHLNVMEAVSRVFPVSGRTGRPVNYSTVWRWIRHGLAVRGTSERVRLVAWKSGEQLTTTLEEVLRFRERLTAACGLELPAPTPKGPTPAERRETRRRLENAGIRIPR